MLNKTLKYSLLLAVTALSSTAFAESTVSVGYAYSKIEDVKLKGVNAQYRYEWDSPVSVVVSASHLKGDEKWNTGHADVKYTSLLAGPAYRFNDMVSVYGVAGFAKSTIDEREYNSRYEVSKTSFAYGAGVEVNPVSNLSVHLGYEGTKVGEAKAKGFNIGVGYRF